MHRKRFDPRINNHYYLGSQNVSPAAVYAAIERNQEHVIVHWHICGEPCNDECEEVNFKDQDYY